MTLLILAAGMGSRYGGIKQFDGVGPDNEYLLEYNIYDAIHAGFGKIVIVTKPELVTETSAYIQRAVGNRAEVICVGQSLEDIPHGFQLPDERLKPWGTAHAVWSARNVTGESFTMINADDFYGRNAFKKALSMTGKTGLIGYKLTNTLSPFGTVSRGVCQSESGYLTSIREYRKIGRDESHKLWDEETGTEFTGEEHVSMNMWALTSEIFPEIEDEFRKFLADSEKAKAGELLLPDIIQIGMSGRNLEVRLEACDSEWIGMTYKEDKQNVQEKLLEFTQKKRYPSPLWS